MVILGNHYTLLPWEEELLLKRPGVGQVISIEQYPDPDETIARLGEVIETHRIKFVVLNLPRPASRKLITYLTRLDLKGVEFLTLERFMERFLGKCFIPDEESALRFLQEIHHLNWFQRIQKGVIDYLGALLLVLLAWPVMIWAACRIRRESLGPVFFSQNRVGRDGHLFRCMKFRSMHHDCHFDPYTQKDDDRIFDFGHFMRRARIDELPQLFNVLKGEMALIGPRAEWDILVGEYEEQIPYYNERHLVKPGITGWAQVNYPYGTGPEDARQKLMYDLYYIKHWSIWLDFKIAFKTIGVVLKRKGR